jgi:hypothetical protein
VTNEKRNPPKTEKCPTCGGEAKLDERRYTEQDEVAYSCRNGLSHYFFDSDPHLEVRRLRSELDRARKVVKSIAALNPDDDTDYGWNEWGEADCYRQAVKIAKGYLAADAPTENKSNG